MFPRVLLSSLRKQQGGSAAALLPEALGFLGGRRALSSLPAFDYKPKPYVGPSKDEVLAMRKAHLSPSELTLGPAQLGLLNT